MRTFFALAATRLEPARLLGTPLSDRLLTRGHESNGLVLLLVFLMGVSLSDFLSRALVTRRVSGSGTGEYPGAAGVSTLESVEGVSNCGSLCRSTDRFWTSASMSVSASSSSSVA